MSWTRWIVLGVGVFLWGRLAAADIACVEWGTEKLLEYQSNATPGTCLKNWVTANPQYGYTADQIEERTVTKQEGEALVRKADQAIVDAAQSIAAKRQAALASGDAKLKALGLTEEELKAQHKP